MLHSLENRCLGVSCLMEFQPSFSLYKYLIGEKNRNLCMLGGLRDSSPQSNKNRRMKHMITESNASRYFFNELISISHDVINSQIPLTNSLTLQTGLLEDLDSVPNSAITLLSQSKRSYRCPDVPFTCDRLQTMSILSFKPHNNLDLEFKRLAQDHTVKS